jgi:hypothetical protein
MDERVLLVKYDTEPIKVRFLKEQLEKKDLFRFGGKSIRNVDLLVQRFFDYLDIIPEEFEGFKELSDEITHFEKIKVYLRDIKDLKEKIESVSQFGNKEILIYELRNKQQLLDEKQFAEEIERISKITKEAEVRYHNKELKIKHIANHYYIPVILSKNEKIDYIKHIIKTESEAEFIEKLEEYLAKEDNRFKEFDWWLFSKIDESLDRIYIPYYEPNGNRIREFKPDFIFWFQKGEDYFIVFVDPKSVEFAGGYRKIDGYKILFEDKGQARKFLYNGLQVRVKLFFVSEKPPLKEYKDYWCSGIEDILNKILNEIDLATKPYLS